MNRQENVGGLLGKTDILSLDDVKTLVNEFYLKVQKDDLIGPIFERVIQGNWEPHLNKMYRFWQTLLLNERTYEGAPFLPHMNLPIEGPHFDRWMALFNETVDEYFVGEKADEAKWRADKMAALFTQKLEMYRRSQQKPLI